jgi:hypothetical protein
MECDNDGRDAGPILVYSAVSTYKKDEVLAFDLALGSGVA